MKHLIHHPLEQKFRDFGTIAKFIYKDDIIDLSIESIEDLEERIGKEFADINMGDIMSLLSGNSLLMRTLSEQYNEEEN